MKLYTDPKFKTFDNDISKDWYIWFKYRHNGQWHLKIVKKGINRIKKVKERLEAMRGIKDALLDELKRQDWDKLGEKPKNIIQVLDEILEAKKPYLRTMSFKNYRFTIATFKKWLEDNKYGSLHPDKITPSIARAFATYLSVDKKLAGVTYNVQTTFIKTFFNVMVKREIINKNPFNGIGRRESNPIRNQPYSDVERARLIEYLKKNHIRIYYVACFIFYCFVRRTELINLKVKHIHLENHTITIPGDISKNKKANSVTIPVQFESVLKEMQLDKHDPEDYIFGFRYKTCSRKTSRVDSWSKVIRRVNRKLKISENKGLYSIKHSGMIALYTATKDPLLCMNQARHSELKMTMIYLRSLGLTVDQGVRQADFKF